MTKDLFSKTMVLIMVITFFICMMIITLRFMSYKNDIKLIQQNDEIKKEINSLYLSHERLYNYINELNNKIYNINKRIAEKN